MKFGVNVSCSLRRTVGFADKRQVRGLDLSIMGSVDRRFR